ncbi:hypothetical protein VTK26DRAFT_5399 [Humicola hyalothermophila]
MLIIDMRGIWFLDSPEDVACASLRIWKARKVARSVLPTAKLRTWSPFNYYVVVVRDCDPLSSRPLTTPTPPTPSRMSASQWIENLSMRRETPTSAP